MTLPANRNRFDAQEMVNEILDSAKYRALGIPQATVQDLIEQAAQTTDDAKEIRKRARQKLHNLVAPYLGDVDYSSATKALETAYSSGSDEEKQQVCLSILSSHASTRERIPILSEFYAAIFQEIGTPRSILDTACGLNPFSLSWMHLPGTVQYHAYDIVKPRVELINLFLGLNGMQPLAERRDILLQPPTGQADAAFFFKEAHRFEQRQKGSTRTFLQSLPARWILLSLPTVNLTGTHSKLDQHRKLVYTAIQGFPWQVKELLFENEIVFCIRKGS